MMTNRCLEQGKIVYILALRTSLIDVIIIGRPIKASLEWLLFDINVQTCGCSQMKVLAISTPNLPTPPPDYFHLRFVEDRMEAWRLSLWGFLKLRPVKLMM